MTQVASSASKGRYAASGAVAGAVSALAFTVIHDIFISDIWFSLVPMLAAGALCGLCIGWSYALLVRESSAGSWLRYNLLYVAMFALLGALSVLAFEPVTTMAAVVSANGPPDALIGQALPLTAAFTLGMAILVTLLYRAGWKRFGAVLLTCVTLVLLLGLNVSVIGLVDIPRLAVSRRRDVRPDRGPQRGLRCGVSGASAAASGFSKPREFQGLTGSPVFRYNACEHDRTILEFRQPRQGA
ncbi:MAG: hypothetical protein R2844_13750 [Caldilineales bacterium]